MSGVLASIPSPSTGVYHVGPLTIHMYGLMLLLGIAAAIWLTGRRWVKWGGDWDLVYRVSIWGVVAGIVGARAYHLITSWNQDSAIHAHWYGPFAVWSGGLGIWGAIPLGVAAGAWVVHRSGASVRLFMDAVAPGLLLAQGIGRWGNYFNQELYGKAHHPAVGPQDRRDARASSTSRPSCTSSSGICSASSCCSGSTGASASGGPRCSRSTSPSTASSARTRRRLRVDPSNHFLGERINFWVSLVCLVASLAFFVWWQFLRKPSSEAKPPARKARPRPIPTGPRMAVPKGRVR